MSKGRILIVDDDRDTRDLITQITTIRGYDAAACETGQDTLRLLEGDDRFNLILCDVLMRGMDGMTLLNTVRTQHPHIPVVMVSAHPRPDWIQQAAELGASHYLAKPFTIKQLMTTVERYIAQTSQPSASV